MKTTKGSCSPAHSDESSEASSAGRKLPKPCHNCRRQRLRCDGCRPYCMKCTVAGKECLGYGQLFRWTDSVATRGTLAGQASSQAIYEKSHGANKTKKRDKPRYQLMGQTLIQGIVEEGIESSVDSDSPNTSHKDEAMQMLPVRQQCSSSHAAMPDPWGLADPLYQDLSNSDRFYLSYFVTRFCQDLVALDMPNQNPFRDLIPLSHSQPLLQNILISNAAAHMSNITGMSTVTADWTSPLPAMSICPLRRPRSELLMRDALVAKQKALSLMRTALQNIESWNSDVVFAAAYCFINTELIESGKQGWRAHLEGTVRLIGLLNKTRSSSQQLRDYILSDCAVYLILASAFLPSGDTATELYKPREMRELLDRATHNCYVCCPPEILEVLHYASVLSRSADTTDPTKQAELAAAGAELIRRAQDLDLQPWAKLRDAQAENPKTATERTGIHVGQSHGHAACLYILQAVPQILEFGLVDADLEEQIALKLLEQLSLVPEPDANFKGTTWPTFILGAGAIDMDRRIWVMNRMRRLVALVPWGFLFTAMETLQVLWGLETSQEAGGIGKGGLDPIAGWRGGQRNRRKKSSWVQIMKDPDLNFLIV